MAEAKKKVEVTEVTMTDGRVVGFAGKRKVLKSTIINQALIEVDGGNILVQPGAVAIRMDFRNGETRTLPLSAIMLPLFAGHGAEQKYGDELAAPADKPMSEEDMVVAIDDLHTQLYDKGEWRVVSEGGSGGLAGASNVIKAIVEASGKSIQEVKDFLQKKLDAAKAAGNPLSRQKLYDSFKNPATKIGAIYARLEQEKLAKEASVDADAELAELVG